MSLTFFVNTPEVRERFRDQFPMPKVQLKGPCLVPPSGINPRLVGTAVDYLFRFYVERINEKVNVRQWVAESGCEMVAGTYPEEGKLAKKIMRNAKENHSRFIKTGKLEDTLIKSTLKLSLLDLVVRAWRLEIRNKIAEKNVKEIRDMYNVAVKSNFFQSKRKCFLNPTFGMGSALVIGGDADLILGDTLIDFKTTKDMQFDQPFYNQLIGYYLLSELGGEPVKIKKVGVYFSRYGVLCLVPVHHLNKEDGFFPFLKWFVEAARKFHRKVGSEESSKRVMKAVRSQIKKIQTTL